MLKSLKFFFIIILAVLLQVTIFPAYLDDPFKPNLLLIIVVYLGFRGNMQMGSVTAFILGVVNDAFSGIYLGLHAFSYLFIFMLLNKIANRFYTENSFLMVLGAFLATITDALIAMLLVMMFSAAEGIYYPVLMGMLPQGLVNALAASVIFSVAPMVKLEEGA